MKVIRQLCKIKKFKTPVVTLGVFDGVHRAHRIVLEGAVKKAIEINGTSIAVTFFPHPQKKKSLHSLSHRLSYLEKTGIDVTVVVRFNKSFSKMSAEDFVRRILVNKISARYVYIGRNFRFGRNASGDIRLMRFLSRVYDFKLKVFPVIRAGKTAVSSTYIRRLVSRGDIARAEKLLSRAVSVYGTVIKGNSLAKKLGFPTANINPHHEVLPSRGIYLVRIILDGNEFKGVCYIGSRPTLAKDKAGRGSIAYGDSAEYHPKHVEVHIFDFHKNIYGKDLDIQFIKRIRKERRFASVDALAAQIRKDVIWAKKQLAVPAKV